MEEERVVADGGNPFRDYMEGLVRGVPSLKCILISDVHGTTRLHAAGKDTDWKTWRHLSGLYLEPDQLEQTLQYADELPRKLKRTLLFLNDFVIVQDAYQPPAGLPTSSVTQSGDWGALSPVVVISLVGGAVNGEGDMGALLGLLEKLKECPMFQAIASAVLLESEYE
eukprot:TRINITY_DN2817_c0_g1_i1.p1 TRINITY_DN2817_c0_g1~~TRINITY_DN2817_c0_g1_i1.p1  ORF type:complete len:168 (+),score=15.31 TRINITY_DN2817_c0_g1_i1:76-579(+)